MGSGPIFIGGLDRCGKTLMRALLVSHPNFAIPVLGSNYWTYFYGQYGDLSTHDNFERCLAAMLRYKHTLSTKPDPDRIRKEFWQGEPTYARLFALFHQHYAEREGKPRWGDQSGLIERYADLVLTSYPTAKMIHMIRDPRDRYEASITRYPNGKLRVGGATARWLYSVELARRNQQRYPDHYKIVRYETLVREPEQTMREVCFFLNEPFVPSMLTLEGAPEFRDKDAHKVGDATAERPISTAYIGRFRQVVPLRELAFMQGYAGQEMVAFDYQLEPIQFSLGDRLRYSLVDWPANLVRMVTWRTVEAVQQNFPAQFGRKPAPGTLLKSAGT
jgi:hypothetical protein